MNCDVYRSEMYAWRPAGDEKGFQPFDHLDSCAECARFFEQLTASDEHIRRTFQGYPESPYLESRILSGLAHQRAQAAARRTGWRWWMLAPALVPLLIVLFVWVAPHFEQARLNREMVILLSKPPALEINSTDRKQLLEWSASQLQGSRTLPAELDKVEFRGGAAIRLAAHKAVFLKMKNEQRASLVIVDAPLTQDNRFHPMQEGSGSASLWSDGRRSYVLLFNGTDQELHAYMTKMGIIAQARKMYPGLHWFSMTFARLTLWVNFLVNGIYSLARNPTYLGLLLPAKGWVLALRSGKPGLARSA